MDDAGKGKFLTLDSNHTSPGTRAFPCLTQENLVPYRLGVHVV